MLQKYKKILITGANGFLGTNVVREFASRGISTRVVVRRSNATLDSCESCEVVFGSVMNFEDMSRAAAGCDAIVHICAITDQSLLHYSQYRDFNVGSLEVSVAAARSAGISRVVFVSSANTIGNGASESQPGDENTALKGFYARQFYGRSKVEAEAFFFAQTDIEGVVVNPCFMLGAYDKGPSSGELIIRGYGKRVVVASRGGKNVVDVEYAAAAVCNAVEVGRSGERYLLAGENISFTDFYKLVGEIDGVKKTYIGFPQWVLLIGGYMGDMLRWFGVRTRLSSLNVKAICMKEFYSGAKAQRELSLQPTNISAAIQKAVDWFKTEKML